MQKVRCLYVCESYSSSHELSTEQIFGELEVAYQSGGPTPVKMFPCQVARHRSPKTTRTHNVLAFGHSALVVRMLAEHEMMEQKAGSDRPWEDFHLISRGSTASAASVKELDYLIMGIMWRLWGPHLRSSLQ